MVRFSIGLLPNEPYRSSIEMVRMGEELGFEILWVGDTRFFRDAFSTMALCAANSKKIKIGVAVTNPYTRSPAITALSIATIDEIAGGRAILGLGAGGAGLKQLCIERRKPIGAMRDTMEVVRAMLAGKAATRIGDVVKVEGAKLDFETRANIPIYIGGHGPKLLELAGEVADGVSMGGGRGSSAVGVGFAMKHIKAGAARSKRSVDELDIMSWMGTCVDADGQRAIDRMRTFVAIIVHNTVTPVLVTLGINKDWAESMKRDFDKMGYHEKEIYAGDRETIKKLRPIINDDLVKLLTLAGTPDDCVRKIKEVSSLGTKLIGMLPFPAEGVRRPDMVRYFAQEVMPAF